MRKSAPERVFFFIPIARYILGEVKIAVSIGITSIPRMFA